MATTTKAAKTFGVACPFCGEREGSISIDLLDLSSVVCSGCDEQFTPRQAVAKANEQLNRWLAVARWVDAAGDALAVGSDEEE